MRMVVLLPAPLGPSTPKISPRCTVERDVAHGDQLAEPALQVLRLDDRLAVLRARRRGGHDGAPPAPDGATAGAVRSMRTKTGTPACSARAASSNRTRTRITSLARSVRLKR